MKKVTKGRNREMRAYLNTVIIKRMKGTEEKMLLYSGPVLHGIAVGAHTCIYAHTNF